MKKLFLFDIEGTTTPISFVHQVLFPYSVKKIDSFLKQNTLETNLLASLKTENELDFQQGKFTEQLYDGELLDEKALLNYLKFLVSVDRKSTALKEIQGKIWNQGYLSNELQSILFDDTPVFFSDILKKEGKIGIYSSGSVEAQQLIFQYSNFGNLSGFISYYFDTKVGGKREPNSYAIISKSVNLPPSEIAFFTDIKEEADAASQIGFEVCIMDRPGNLQQPVHNYRVLKNFGKYPNIN
jgi:enolase-phosphatase E1